MWQTLKKDPIRPRDWRSRLVKHMLLEGNSVSRRCQDKPLYIAFLYYKARQKSPVMSFEETLKLQAKFPEMHTAYHIYTSRDYFRHTLEALVMADTSPEDIAKEFGCDAATIRLYEEIYFDIRSRLSAKLFISDELLSPLFSGQLSAVPESDFLWKAVAYYCGKETLESFWGLEASSPADAAKVKDLFKSKLQKQAFGALFSRSPNSYNAHEIVEEYITVNNMDGEEESEESTENKLDEHAQNILQSIHLSITPLKAVKGVKEGRVLQPTLPEDDDYDRKTS